MPDSATAQLPPDQGLYPTLISGKGPLYQTLSLPLDGAAINLANIQLDKSSSNPGPIATPTPTKTNDNNPGNIKTFGPNGQLIYASYDNPQAGVQAIGDWAVKAQQTHGLTTVRQLIDDPQHGYAPQADPGNRGKPLVEEAAARMGVSPDEPIDLTNPAVKQKWTDAILAQEGHGDKASAGSLQSFQQSQAATSSLIAQRQAQLDKVLASLSTGKGDTQERRKMLQDALDHSRELQDQILNMSRNPPTQKPTDLMSTFGSLAMLIGAIGGLKSRQPATAALQAAAGVIEGVNTNNHEEFERNFKTWQVQSKLLEDLTGIQSQDFRAILENDRLDETERHNQMEETMQKWEMGDSLFKLQAGQIEEAYKGPFEIMRLHEDLNLKRAQVEEAQAKAAKDRALAATGGKATQMLDVGNVDEQGHAKPYLIDGSGNAFTQETITSEDGTTSQIRKPYTPIQPSKVPTTTAASTTNEQLFQDLRAAEESKDPDKIQAAHQAIKDHNEAIGKGPRFMGAPGLMMQKFLEENPKASSMEMANFSAESRRLITLDSAFASGVLGRNVISLNTVADHIALAREYFEDLKNGQIPRANAVANLFARERGKPEITSFEAGRIIMADEIARLLTSTGGTEQDRAGLQNATSANYSPEQGEGVFTAFERFVKGRFEALQQGYSLGDPKREQEFHDKLLTQKSRDLFDSVKGSRGSLPEGIPSRSKKIGTSGGNDVYETPDGKRLMVH